MPTHIRDELKKILTTDGDTDIVDGEESEETGSLTIPDDELQCKFKEMPSTPRLKFEELTVKEPSLNMPPPKFHSFVDV